MRSMDRIIRSVVATFIAGVMLVFLGAPAAMAAEQTFPSPEAAMAAFGDAIATSDEDALKVILGADFRELIPPMGAEIRYRFLEQWARAHAIKAAGEAKAVIAVGNDGWTLPVPIVKTTEGWRFDTRAGADEIRIRRIGRNEHAVMQVMLAIFDAQKEYAGQDRNGNGVREYAMKFESSPGKRDGLYWPTRADEEPSPLGPAVARARAAGGGGADGYFGYRYKLLTAQGPNAPGGAFDFMVGARMMGGFSVVAWPVRYGDTGVVTFMVSHDGVMYEQDLGPDTARKAAALKRFDPDASWRKTEPGR